MLTDYIAAMNLIAKTTDNFSRPPALNPTEEGNDYIWIEQMLERAKDDDETPERRAIHYNPSPPLRSMVRRRHAEKRGAAQTGQGGLREAFG